MRGRFLVYKLLPRPPLSISWVIGPWCYTQSFKIPQMLFYNYRLNSEKPAIKNTVIFIRKEK